MKDVRCWATSTDLAGTDQQRVRYFLAIEDGDKRTDVELIIGPGPALSVEPFVPHEFDYTVHDFCDHEHDYCVLEDENAQYHEDQYVNEAFYFDKHKHSL